MKHSSLRVPSRHRVVPVPLPVGHRALVSLPRVLGLSVPWTLFPLRSFRPSLRTRNLKSRFLSLGVDSLHSEKVSAIVVCAYCNKRLGFFKGSQKVSEQLGEEQCVFIFKLSVSKFRYETFAIMFYSILHPSVCTEYSFHRLTEILGCSCSLLHAFFFFFIL